MTSIYDRVGGGIVDAPMVARLKHELWNYERISCSTEGERRERDDRCGALRRQLEMLGATPVGEQMK